MPRGIYPRKKQPPPPDPFDSIKRLEGQLESDRSAVAFGRAKLLRVCTRIEEIKSRPGLGVVEQIVLGAIVNELLSVDTTLKSVPPVRTGMIATRGD